MMEVILRLATVWFAQLWFFYALPCCTFPLRTAKGRSDCAVPFRSAPSKETELGRLFNPNLSSMKMRLPKQHTPTLLKFSDVVVASLIFTYLKDGG